MRVWGTGPSDSGRGPGRRSAGFTLVELMVVIATIAILVAILIPAVEEARSKARDVLCRSQLRQIGTAYTSYANDFRGYYPFLHREDGSHANQFRTFIQWSAFGGYYGTSGSPAPQRQHETIERYLQPSAAYTCPFTDKGLEDVWPEPNPPRPEVRYRWWGYTSFTPLGPPRNTANPATGYTLPSGNTVDDQTRVLNVRAVDYPDRPLVGDGFRQIFNPNPDRYFGPHLFDGVALRTGGYPSPGDAKELTNGRIVEPMNYVYPDGSVVSSKRIRKVAGPVQAVTWWHVR